jgi:hypothetical protein
MARLSSANSLQARLAHIADAGRDGGHFAAMVDLGHRNFGGALVPRHWRASMLRKPLLTLFLINGN